MKFDWFASALLLLLIQSLTHIHQVYSSSSSSSSSSSKPTVPKSTEELPTRTNSKSWTQSLTSFGRHFCRKQLLGQSEMFRNVWNDDHGSSSSSSKVTSSEDNPNNQEALSRQKLQPRKEHQLRTDEWEIHYKAGLWKSAVKHPYIVSLDPLYKIVRKVLIQHPCILTCKQHCRRLSPRMIRTDQAAATEMRFHRNGFCKLNPVAFPPNYFHCKECRRSTRKNGDCTSIQGNHCTLRVYPHIGRWTLNHHGCICWDVPISILLEKDSNDKSKDSNDVVDTSITPYDQKSIESSAVVAFTTLHFVADLHINRFGSQPRMHKGIVTCDRLVPSCFSCCCYDKKKSNNNMTSKNYPFSPTLFRPVVGSFVATGIGIDTLDHTYKNRKMGLTN